MAVSSLASAQTASVPQAQPAARAAERGATFWLVGLNPAVLEVVRRAGLDKRLGRERLLFNAREAIARYLDLPSQDGKS